MSNLIHTGTELNKLDRYDLSRNLNHLRSYRQAFCKAMSKAESLPASIRSAQREHLELIDLTIAGTDERLCEILKDEPR